MQMERTGLAKESFVTKVLQSAVGGAHAHASGLRHDPYGSTHQLFLREEAEDQTEASGLECPG